MIQGSLYKFTQNEHLRTHLLNTEKRIFIEASPYDRVWGIGFTKKNAASDKGRWGLNLLGNALMEVRRRLWAVEEANQEKEDGDE